MKFIILQGSWCSINVATVSQPLSQYKRMGKSVFGPQCMVGNKGCSSFSLFSLVMWHQFQKYVCPSTAWPSQFYAGVIFPSVQYFFKAMTFA